MQIGYEGAELFSVSLCSQSEIVEDPFLRPRTDSRMNYYSLVQKTITVVLSQSVIPRIVRNGVGRKKSGIQGPPPVR